eukprot:SAG11_NODE_29720_length_308_cov_0.497608_1_plen_74_part_01
MDSAPTALEALEDAAPCVISLGLIVLAYAVSSHSTGLPSADVCRCFTPRGRFRLPHSLCLTASSKQRICGCAAA